MIKIKRKHKRLIYGIASFFPGANQFIMSKTRGTDSARYCYSVWLRHIIMAKQSGLNPYPKSVAELGPGDSLGIGFSALISGSEKYFAFDVINYVNTERNLKIFDELVLLFMNRTPVPGEKEFPRVGPYLERYDFPSDILNEDRLHYALNPSRLDQLRCSVADLKNSNSFIKYKAPWYHKGIIENGSIDMIYSQAVLEHVDDLRNTYKAMYLWLNPSGYISHIIDFKCHGTADEWNGHWTYSDMFWKLMRGQRTYLLNREPYSAHIAILREEGFKIFNEQLIKSESNLKRKELAPKYKLLSDNDLVTSMGFIQGVKQ